MITQIPFRGLLIEHRIDRRLRNTHIIIEEDARVILKTPLIHKTEITRLLEKKADWILKMHRQQKERRDLSVCRGEEVRYLGRSYRLTEDPMFATLHRCVQRATSDDAIDRCYDRFYRKQAIEHLTERAGQLANATGLRPSELRFRKMRRRWGSCSSSSMITLNTRLMLLPEHLIDHVIIHELAHLRHLDHSRAFYDEMKKHQPEYRELQKELRMIRSP